MALINKINERSGVIAGVIAVALILFMLGGDILSNNSIFNFGKDRIGKINGESISLPQYQNSLANQEMEYQINTDRSVGENERQGVEFQAWNDLIARFAYQPEYDKLGLVVTNDETIDMIKGKFIHPQIVSAFGGGNGQPFDKSSVINFLDNFSQVPPNIQQRWALIKRKLPELRIKEKYANLLKKSEYTTKEEAKRVYKEQNDKATLNYVFVPFSTIADSAVSVNDDKLEDYIKKNKDSYKVEAGKSIQFVSFAFSPSSEDSALIQKEASELKEDFKTTDNDSLFIKGNSDTPADPSYLGVNELPSDLSSIALANDSVYGPSLSNGKYVLFKILNSKNDSISSLKASHILFRTDVDKESARQKANDVLAQIKRGASFEEMAAIHGTDGTSTRGGDLGWFSNNGQMVKPFEDACFRFNGRGLLPSLVETQFGFHIIKITEPKTNKKYLVAKVEKEITALDGTKDILYNKASAFAAAVKDTQTFAEEVKKDPTLKTFSSPNVGKNERTLSGITNAREIIRWAYNDAKVGSVSNVFTTEDQYVVAILTGEREEGTASVDDVRNEVTAKVKNELKAEEIIKKLNGLSGDLASIATTYGNGALNGKAENITFSNSTIASIGFDPVACGKAFGIKTGKRTTAFKGETGVVILELLEFVPAPEVADYNQFKTQKETQRAGMVDYHIDETIKKLADIKDERYKFY